MTQSDLAEKLSLSRQSISQYELGDSFPDIGILVLIADIFRITLDELIASGEPTRGESKILDSVAHGNYDITVTNVRDIVSLAPLLKPSILHILSEKLSYQGIDISHIITLAEYLSEESVLKRLQNVEITSLNHELLEKLLPFLDTRAKEIIFQKMLDEEIDWQFIRAFLPYAEYMISQIEFAVLEGALPKEVLSIVFEYINGKGM